MFALLTYLWLLIGLASPITYVNGCSCCCPNFGCLDEFGVKQFPETLTATFDMTGQCPQAVNASITVTLTRIGDDTTCEDAVDCGCGCGYDWTIDPDDVPLCGPYIGEISFACDQSLNGIVIDNCPHLWGMQNACFWAASVYVYRTDQLRHGVEACPLTIPPGPPQHLVQSCDDCTWSCVDGAGDPVCCDTCPPCYVLCPPTCDDASGAPCCGDCNDWKVIDDIDPENDESCTASCAGLSSQGRRYDFGFGGCGNPTDIKGCNVRGGCSPTGDPSADVGNFSIHMTQIPTYDDGGSLLGFTPACTGVYLDVGCAGTGMALAAKSPKPAPFIPKPEGPGTELEKILATLGLTPFKGCSCVSIRNEMDKIGPDECRKNVARLTEKIEMNAARVGWLVKLKAAALAIAHGIIVDPANPIPGLIEEACKRAEID